MKLLAGVVTLLVCVGLYAGFPYFLPLTLTDSPQLNLPRTKLTIENHTITVQLAETRKQRAIGLMFRSELPQHEGMLFVYDKAAIQCFWMKNTNLPLSIAFIADDGIISNLADMAPHSTKQHCATMPVRFALEMNQGWFAQNGVNAGDIVDNPLFVIAR